MAAALFVLLLAVPLVELWIVVQAAGELGLLPTLLLLVLISVAGAWLLKQQGVQTWRRVGDALRRGRMPTEEVTDGALILLGGALLLTPGFLTDVVGLVFLVPLTRAVVKSTARRLLGWWARRQAGASSRWVSHETQSPGPHSRSGFGVRKPGDEFPELGDGSRDRD
jgi:UPF0716 protein FxsA